MDVKITATKPNADGEPICRDYAVPSACGHMVIIEKLKTTLGMMLDGEIVVWRDVKLGGYNTSSKEHTVGSYPTRLEAVLALADELGM